MTKTITLERNKSLRFYSTVLAGAVASFLTQPLEVIKTNRINSPATFYHDLHKTIIRSGWKTYMRGSSLAVVRQGYGFTLYTQLLTSLENSIARSCPSLNKFLNYSLSSVTAKLVAMMFEAPLTLLKTRVECVTSASVLGEFKKLRKSSYKQLTKGLGSSIAREGLYTVFHYNTYRYLKDDFFLKSMNYQTTFVPAFFAGIVAITVSQPFEVLRSKISLTKFNEPVLLFARLHWKEFGMRGFFLGFVPRLLRKPINSGICWSILQWCRSLE